MAAARVYSKKMRIALLADIHGNLPALEAVGVVLQQIQPDLVLLDGDIINATPFSAEVVDHVRSQKWAVVRGNHEFYYLDYGTERAAPGYADPTRWGQLHWLMAQIRPDQGAYLATLPDELTLYIPGTQPLRVAHGVPGRNRIGFYNQQPDAKIAPELAAIQEHTVISAHTHVQIDRQIPRVLSTPTPHHDQATGAGTNGRQWHLINPGSVGLPLNGIPKAQFAVIENVAETAVSGGWQATMHQVEYDRRPVLDAFQSTGMLESGGVITQLFYWQVVTAQPEIVLFYRWARENGVDPDQDAITAFRAYVADARRDAYVRALDPRYR